MGPGPQAGRLAGRSGESVGQAGGQVSRARRSGGRAGRSEAQVIANCELRTATRAVLDSSAPFTEAPPVDRLLLSCAQ
jgi:hypothetical protein